MMTIFSSLYQRNIHEINTIVMWNPRFYLFVAVVVTALGSGRWMEEVPQPVCPMLTWHGSI